MTADKDALLRDAMAAIDKLRSNIGSPITNDTINTVVSVQARITAALAEKDDGGFVETPYKMTIKWDHGETVHEGVITLPKGE